MDDVGHRPPITFDWPDCLGASDAEMHEELELEVKEALAGAWGARAKPGNESGGRRHVCFNPQEAKHDGAAREAILAAELESPPSRG